MKKFIAAVLTGILLISTFSGCTNNQTTSSSSTSGVSGSISLDGSSALKPLVDAATPLYKAKNSNVIITCGGAGSGAGITAVFNKTVDIGNSDVTPNQAGKDGTGLVNHNICVVAVGIVVSDNVYSKIKNITNSDLTAIFSGTKTYWNQITGWTGGSLPIQVYYRKSGSGTRTLFETYGSNKVLTDMQLGAFTNFTKKESSGDLESAIINQVATAGAIGYDTLPYCKNLKLLTFDGVACNYDKVYTGEYKIWGYEHMYTNGAAKALSQSLIDFMTSTDMQSTIMSSGYGLISLMKITRP